LRKAEAEKKRIERAQIKKSSSQKIKFGEKKSIDDDEINLSRKRMRIVRSHLNNQPLSIKLTQQLDSTVIEYSNDTNNDLIIVTDVLQLQNTKK
jgi:hypothetical protein